MLFKPIPGQSTKRHHPQTSPVHGIPGKTKTVTLLSIAPHSEATKACHVISTEDITCPLWHCTTSELLPEWCSRKKKKTIGCNPRRTAWCLGRWYLGRTVAWKAKCFVCTERGRFIYLSSMLQSGAESSGNIESKIASTKSSFVWLTKVFARRCQCGLSSQSQVLALNVRPVSSSIWSTIKIFQFIETHCRKMVFVIVKRQDFSF